MPPIEVSAVGTKGRDLKLQAIFQDDDDAEMRANRIGAAEDFLHLFGSRVGRDIDVFRRLAADEITHTTAGEIGYTPGCAQAIHERASRGFHRAHRIHCLTSLWTHGLSRLG